MKTRNGFVSNSSSSSFVVKYYKKEEGKKRESFLAPQQVKKLKKYGFKITCVCRAEHYDGEIIDKEWLKYRERSGVYLGFDVVCNQDDVVYFLLKNNIAFTASCHYGDHNLFYDGGKHFYRIENVGRQVEVESRILGTSPSKAKKEWEGKWFEEINVDKFLKQKDKWEAEFKKLMKDNK